VCASSAAVLAVLVVRLFGWKDPNVHPLTTEMCLHGAAVLAWLWLTSMGHHVWSVITSETVFTRVTDGTRLARYALAVILGLAAVGGGAVSVALFVVEEERRLPLREITTIISITN